MRLSRWLSLLAVCCLAAGGLLFCADPGQQEPSKHIGCPAGQTCMAADCTVDSDCPQDLFGAWSECTGGHDACAVDGTQRRTAIAFACEGGICRPHEGVETRECERVTDGLACDDGNGCTAGDACAGGLCQGQPERCDDGNACTADSCSAELGCRHAPVPSCRGPVRACKNAGAACSTGKPCEQGEIRCIDGQAQCVAVGLADASTECRPASGSCDLAEFCTGTSADCPDDRLSSDESVCRPAVGPCDRGEICTGTGPDCPPDQFLPAETVCRPGVNGCDVSETCTGSSTACPEDDGGCVDGAYCLVATCWALPTIEIRGGMLAAAEGGEGASCVDLAGSDILFRVIFRGRPGAAFRYMKRHASCAGSFFTEQPDVPCDEGTVGLLDAGGTCTLTMRSSALGAVCANRNAGRWEVYAEIDGQRSRSSFFTVHNSSPTCADNPRTCDAAIHFCPLAGACNDATCVAGDRVETALSDLPDLDE